MASSVACKHPALYNSLCVVCGVSVKQQQMGNDLSTDTDSTMTSKSNSNMGNWNSVLTIPGGKTLQLSQEEVVHVQVSKANHLHHIKKLALVLDLDHTLLHAAQVEGQTPTTRSVIEYCEPPDTPTYHLPIEEIVNGTVKHLVMKKRPQLDHFLDQCQSFCQMTIYTAGTRRYAESVAKILDPTRRYFGDRIVSRTDFPNGRPDGNEKSLERIFPGDSSMAVIIDDREDVWKGAQSEQLLLVRPFVHFDPAGGGCSSFNSVLPPSVSLALGKVTNPVINASTVIPMCPAITLCGTDSEPSGRLLKLVPQYSSEFSCLDDQLPRCLQVLRQIHALYYEGTFSTSTASSNVTTIDGANVVNGAMMEPQQLKNHSTGNAVSLPSSNSDISKEKGPSTGGHLYHNQELAKRSVATILRGLKSRVLRGCTVTFSGIINLSECPVPEQHMLWRLAESLGAQVSTHLLPRTTHLVTLSLQSHKAAECLQPTRGKDGSSEVWVLHPDWLVYCRWSLSRASEATFILNPLAAGQSYPQPTMNYEPLQKKKETKSINNNDKNDQVGIANSSSSRTILIKGGGSLKNNNNISNNNTASQLDPRRNPGPGPSLLDTGKRSRDDESSSTTTTITQGGGPAQEDMLSALKRLKGLNNNNHNHLVDPPPVVALKQKGNSVIAAAAATTTSRSNGSNSGRSAVVKVPSPKKRGPIAITTTSNNEKGRVDSGVAVAAKVRANNDNSKIVDLTDIGSSNYMSSTQSSKYVFDDRSIDATTAYFDDPEDPSSEDTIDGSTRRRRGMVYADEEADEDGEVVEEDEEDDEDDEGDPPEDWDDSSSGRDGGGSDLEDVEVGDLPALPEDNSTRRRGVAAVGRRRRRPEEEAVDDVAYGGHHTQSTATSTSQPSSRSSQYSDDDFDGGDSDEFSDFEAMILRRTVGPSVRPTSSSSASMQAWSLPSQGRSLSRNSNNPSTTDNSQHHNRDIDRRD